MFKNSIKNNKGFSLIEVLITISFLSVSMLAITQVQIGSATGNNFSASVSEATNLAYETINTIKAIDYANPTLLLDANPNDFGAGLPNNSVAGPPPYRTFTHTSYINNRFYTIDYNVAQNWPTTNSTTIRVIVSWADPSRDTTQTTVIMDCIKGNPQALN